MGSHQRVYELIQYLKTHHNLTVAYIKERVDQDSHYIKNLDEEVIFIKELKKSKFAQSKIKKFLQKYPIMRQFYEKDVVSKTKTLLKQNNYSHIIIEYLNLSYLFPLFQNQTLILDTHDIMHKRNESFKNNNQKHWLDIDKKEEFDIFSLYNQIICIQQTDHKYLEKNNIKSLTCPHPIKAVQRIPNKKNEIINIIFIGGYSVANFNSIHWFIENIWIFFHTIETLRLNIYGTISQALIRHSKKYQNIILNGKIENLNEVYANADIAINPVQMGGGLKIKNIEAMANTTALITTDEGAKGIEQKANTAYLLANSKDQWIEKMVSLIISKNLQNDISLNGQKFIHKNFNATICFSPLNDFINSAK